MAKQVQAELNKSTGDYFIYVDGRKVDGPLSQAEAIREMRKYDNDPAYKTLPPKFTNTASYQNGRQRATNAISEKLNAFKLGYKGEAEACLNGVRVENITTYVVEGTEYYGGSVFEAVEQWCRTTVKVKPG